MPARHTPSPKPSSPRLRSDTVFHRAASLTAVLEWLHEMRLRQAVTLLEEGLDSDYVAFLLGYASPKLFREDFYRHHGVSPEGSTTDGIHSHARRGSQTTAPSPEIQ